MSDDKDNNGDEFSITRYTTASQPTYRVNVNFKIYSEKHKSYETMSGAIEYGVQPYGLKINRRRLGQVASFLESISDATFLCSKSVMNPLYLNSDGALSNEVTIEVPFNKMEIEPSDALALIYYKIEALLWHYGEVTFISYTDHEYGDGLVLDVDAYQNQNPLVDETLWMRGRDIVADETRKILGSEFNGVLEQFFKKPWWHRDDVTTRDYFLGSGDFMTAMLNEVDVECDPSVRVEELKENPLIPMTSLMELFDSVSDVDFNDMYLEFGTSDNIVVCAKDPLLYAELYEVLMAIDGRDIGDASSSTPEDKPKPNSPKSPKKPTPTKDDDDILLGDGED